MPEYTPYAKTPIPLWPEADQVPPDLKRAFTHIDPMLVLTATDQADRDARYTDIPTGSIVTATEQKAVWRKEDDGWSTIWSDTGVLTSGVATAAKNFTVLSQYGRIRSGHVSVAAAFVWGGDAFVSNSTGDLTNRRLGSVVGETFRPPYTVIGSYSVSGFNGGAYVSSSDGGIWIKDAIANYTFETGKEFLINFEYSARGN